MEFVIGEKIKQKVEEKGITFKAFAGVIGMTPRNLDRFFERKDITINQLVKASEFLDFDFVNLYLKNTKNKSEQGSVFNGHKEVNGSGQKFPINGEKKYEISLQLSITGAFEQVQLGFIDFLDVMKIEAEKRGLSLT